MCVLLCAFVTPTLFTDALLFGCVSIFGFGFTSFRFNVTTFERLHVECDACRIDKCMEKTLTKRYIIQMDNSTSLCETLWTLNWAQVANIGFCSDQRFLNRFVAFHLQVVYFVDQRVNGWKPHIEPRIKWINWNEVWRIDTRCLADVCVSKWMRSEQFCKSIIIFGLELRRPISFDLRNMRTG